MSYRIRLAKENFKFSCTHFTIFGPESAERMHGHNYQVAVELEIPDVDRDLGMGFDFNQVKPVVRSACEDLDEFILIPARSTLLKVTRVKKQLEIHFGKKTYSLPCSDVKALPIANVTSEELARYLAETIAARLKGIKFKTISVHVEETRGQSAAYTFAPKNITRK